MAQSTSPGGVIFPAEVSHLRRAWVYTTGDAIESSPVAADGVVYVGSNDHYLYAFNQMAILE